MQTRPWTEQGLKLLRRSLVPRMLRGTAPRSGSPPSAPAEAPSAPAPPPPRVPFPRRHWTDQLWGEGMLLPGGAEEVLRLASLLPLSGAVTLLLAGASARASGAVISGARGCFVAAFDHDPPPPTPRSGRSRVTAEAFDPACPAFRAGYHHHAMLLEPFRRGGTPEELIAAAARALRPGGQLVLLELVARGEAAGPSEERWIAAEGRAGAPPSEAIIPAALERAGFTIHVVEDATLRQRRAVIAGWQALVSALEKHPTRPEPAAAAALVAEAEAWLLRLRLMQEGRLRLLRWHASRQ